jgi:tRNA threonylcarbamoyladenosine biosynthesis protein TsaE
MISGQFHTSSLAETFMLAQKIGAEIPAGTVIALTGDLGAGKTSFVQGLARGLGIPEACYITSPTYTLINEYPGSCPLFHADLYRLDTNSDFEEIGLYDILYGKNVTAIEWADRLDPCILAEHVAVHIEIREDESRIISVSLNLF